jgi:SAM-dependent methyltransferase
MTGSGPQEAQRFWRGQLAAWAIPDRILAAVSESPWTLPTSVFARRASDRVARPSGVSYERAAEALRTPGSVLDVGAGAGAASLPLAPRATGLTAVDTSEAMLDELSRHAAQLGLAPTVVVGRWPDVADRVEPADLVVCHHVAYNVPDLDAFALALNAHARRRVVLEVTALHPLVPLNPLWRMMHDLDRPERPSAQDAAAVLREAGLRPVVEASPRDPRTEYPSFGQLVEVTRRRVCLPPDRDDDVAAALLSLGVDPGHPRDLPPVDDQIVTLWWDI